MVEGDIEGNRRSRHDDESRHGVLSVPEEQPEDDGKVVGDTQAENDGGAHGEPEHGYRGVRVGSAAQRREGVGVEEYLQPVQQEPVIVDQPGGCHRQGVLLEDITGRVFEDA